MYQNRIIIYADTPAIEDHMAYFQGKNINEIHETLSQISEDDYETLRIDLDVQLEHDIICIAQIGTYRGARIGYRIGSSGNIKEILKSHVRGMSDLTIYFDGSDIRGEEHHHDGVNHYLFREANDDESRDELCGRIYNEGLYPSVNMLNKYTKSIAPYLSHILPINENLYQ